MIKLITAFCLALVLVSSVPITTYAACNDQQSETYVTQIIFGDNALQRQSDDNVKLLMDALYLCSEQSDNLGQEKLDNLKLHKVRKVPSLSDINIILSYPIGVFVLYTLMGYMSIGNLFIPRCFFRLYSNSFCNKNPDL